MRKYTKPEAELEKFLAVDVVTTSTTTDPEPPVGGGDLPPDFGD